MLNEGLPHMGFPMMEQDAESAVAGVQIDPLVYIPAPLYVNTEIGIFDYTAFLLILLRSIMTDAVQPAFTSSAEYLTPVCSYLLLGPSLTFTFVSDASDISQGFKSET